MKKDLLPADSKINTKYIVLLKGSQGPPVPTLGSIEIDIYGVTHKVRVVPKEFPIPCAGILGVDYLDKHRVIIDFGKLVLEVNELYVPLK